ncbi:MAG: HAD hydrolase-like protein, partial [Desulfovibrionaceae bacterium]|nr:HAD hydrolase-like protein [Desulfovibrionaceae bacterium]
MKAFIFDLDGTLLNTLEDIGAACNAILAAHGHPVHPMSAYARMVGNGFPTLIRRIWPADALARLEPEDFEKVLCEARAYYAGHLCERTRPYDGMPETLSSLAAQGFGLAVLSNKPEELTQALI